ncbi:MAG: spermidine/putrescine ABC transporter substrate-binding protein [Nitrososphaerota archaeon]
MVDRRDVLKIMVSGVLGLAIGGVGGYISRQSEVESLKKEVEALSKEIKLEKVELEPNLYIYNWTYYINRNIVDWWARENGVSIVYDTFESLDEVVAKLQTGTSGYDLAVVSDSPLQELANLGVLEPIDLKKIPNFKYVPERFKNPYYDPGNKYSVIYSYGTTGLGWNSQEVSPEVTAWADVFEVDRHLEKYKGKITMHTDTIETFGAALIYLGRDPTSTKDEDLREAVELLKKQKPYLAGYASTEEYMAGLEAGRFLISHAYNGDIAGIIYASDEREITITKNLEYISYTVPEEGALAWADNFVIPKGAKNIEAAHAFINFILDPVISAICTITVKYPFPTGKDYVPEELRNDPVIFTPDELLDKLYWTRPFTPEERAKRAEYWLELMAA